MTTPAIPRVTDTPHPRLTLVILGGIVAFAIGGVIVFVDRVLQGSFGAVAFRAFVVGYILVLMGGAGYVALAVSKRLSMG